MSKLNFRARTLDAAKPMAVYFAEDLPELTELNAINRSVPAMPSGMEKEEEAEKHLQDILELQERPEKIRKKGIVVSELVIPTPEVFSVNDDEGAYDALYKDPYHLPRSYIHVQPFSIDQDLPGYDMDQEDEEFLNKVLREEKKLEVSETTFEDMIERLEKQSGHTVLSASEAKRYLNEDDDLILAVYDYWVDKRLRLKHSLIPTVKTDKRDALGIGGSATSSSKNNSGNSNPYIAFRRRTEKMQTRKNRKNDEASYEKMLKLRRDLSRAVTLLEMVKRREKTKKEYLNLTADIFEKRYHSGDFEGKIISDVLAHKQQLLQHRILQPTYKGYAENWVNNQMVSGSGMSQGHLGDNYRQKRSYTKKKRHKSSQRNQRGGAGGSDFASLLGFSGVASSDDDQSQHAGGLGTPSELEDEEPDGPFTFRRKRNCQYLAPLLPEDNADGRPPPRGWPWEAPEDGGFGEAKYRYSLAFLSTPKPRCIGFVRRRFGRGGRIVLDRAYSNYDQLWRSLDFMVSNGCGNGSELSQNGESNPFEDYPHYRPVTPPHAREEPDYDPYKPRGSESSMGLPIHPLKPLLTSQRSRSALVNGLAGLRPISMDSLLAQNVVTTNDSFDNAMHSSHS